MVVGNGGKQGAVGHFGAERSFVGCAEGGAVGPVVVCIGGGIDGEDDVHGAYGLDERVEGQVLEIFAAVDHGELEGGGGGVGGVVEA